MHYNDLYDLQVQEFKSVVYLDGHKTAILEARDVALPDGGRAQGVLRIERLEHLVCGRDASGGVTRTMGQPASDDYVNLNHTIRFQNRPMGFP